jgi:hypothetical protein
MHAIKKLVLLFAGGVSLGCAGNAGAAGTYYDTVVIIILNIQLGMYPCVRTGRAFGALYFVGDVGRQGVIQMLKNIFKVRLTLYNQFYLGSIGKKKL